MTDRPVVLVSGIRTGIGRYLAGHFVRAGALVEGCSRKPLADPIADVTFHCVNVADEQAVRGMIRDIERRHGRLDVAINNAGAASMNHALLTPLSTVERIFETNVHGTFLISREAARLMQPRGFGRIINLTTVAVPLRVEGEAIYASSKAAVEMLTRVMARELGPFGITVNAVGPSPIETDMLQGIPDDTVQRIVDQLAIKRLGRLEDVANVVDFFARPESGYVTGQVIYLGGPG